MPPLRSLEACYKQIQEKHELNVTIEEINKVLEKDLLQPFRGLLDTKLRIILPYMMVHYMKNWPGWKKANSHKRDVYDDFVSYLEYKIRYLINHDYNVAKKAVLKTLNTGKTLNNEAPVELVISGSAKLLNSIIFSESPDGNITMKQHKETPWESINLRQLVNWPCIQVSFQNKDIHFERENVHEYKRFLLNTTDKSNFSSFPIIESVSLISESKGRKAFTFNLLKLYCDTLLSILKNTNPKDEEIIEECQVVIEEFLFDISEFNSKSKLHNTMASNTAVVFKMGGASYARYKKSRHSDKTGFTACLSELIAPKMKTSLVRFLTPDVDRSNVKLFFNTLHNISTGKVPVPRDFVPTVEFRCSFCETNYMDKELILKHLYEEHYNELSMNCQKCKTQFEAKSLTECRWKHKCNFNIEKFASEM